MNLRDHVHNKIPFCYKNRLPELFHNNNRKLNNIALLILKRQKVAVIPLTPTMQNWCIWWTALWYLQVLVYAILSRVFLECHLIVIYSFSEDLLLCAYYCSRVQDLKPNYFSSQSQKPLFLHILLWRNNLTILWFYFLLGFIYGWYYFLPQEYWEESRR